MKSFLLTSANFGPACRVIGTQNIEERGGRGGGRRVIELLLGGGGGARHPQAITQMTRLSPAQMSVPFSVARKPVFLVPTAVLDLS